MPTTFSRDALLQRQAELSPGKRRLLGERLRGRGPTPHGGPAMLAIPRRADATRPARLSFAQEQIWFLQQLEPNGTTYNESTAVRIRTRYSRSAFERAFLEIQRRHELLRSTFQLVDDDPVQVVAPWPTGWRLPLIDLSHLPADEAEAELARFAHDEPLRPFQLDRDFPWRLAMVQMAEDDHLLMLVQHHIAYDGWSSQAFARELIVLYEAYQSAESNPLPELPIQYSDFAEWERQHLQGAVLEAKLDFWRRQLAGHQNLRLPTDRPRPPLPTTHGATAWFEFEGELVRSVQALADAHHVTPFMAYLAMFDVLLARYTGQTDIVLGTPVANRPRPELENLIGIFLNSLVLRTDLSGDPVVVDVLGRVRNTAVEAFAHQDLPVEFLVSRLPFERDPSRNPLFQVCFDWQDWRHVPRPQFEWAPLSTGLDAPHVTAKFDLSVFVRVVEDTRFSCGWEYNTDLFDAATIQRMMHHFRALLRQAVEDPDTPISRLRLLDADEREQILVGWNASGRAYPADRCMDELFEAAAARTPSAVAVVFGEQHLTYAELDARADRLAAWLRRQGVKTESLVGVCVPRSLDMIVSVLGVLKAGAAYVPLDPEYPAERLAFIREDAHLELVLTPEVIAQACERSAVVDHPADRASSHNLAYVIYTSGSTGRPKGVLISHGSLVNYCDYAREAFGLKAGTRVLQFASLSFDTAAEEIYPCLIAGGTLVLRETDMLGSVAGFLKRCEELQLNVLDLPTSYWHELVGALADGSLRLPACVRLVIIGGERALASDRAIWRQRLGSGVRLVNTYGPTETTIVALSSDLTHADDDQARRVVPIGRPVGNARAYILDEHLEPVPVGVPGELYVGGAGVARGYLGHAELTEQRFVVDPFGDGRMYRTGDLARWRSDGEVEYLGRTDQQVKVRGFRVEPAEIEAVLREHTTVQDCVVLARADQLIAYVVPSPDGADEYELERFARVRLPDYMVPAGFVQLSALPLVPNGKLDRMALPALDFQLTRERTYVAPRTDLEHTLAQMWSQVLGLERVGIHDNFFALGGHSLIAVRLAARVRRSLLVELPVRMLFEAPTVGALADRLAALPRLDADAEAAPIPRIERGGPLPLSFMQERLFRLAQEQPQDTSYNIAHTLLVQGTLDVDALQRSLREVVARHEVLRTRFAIVDGEPRAFIGDATAAFDMVLGDLRHVDTAERQQRATVHVRRLAEQPFDLATGPLMRTGVFRLEDDQWVLALCVHHICFDGASLDVLCGEVSEAYRAYTSGQALAPPPPGIQYADYAAWQQQRVAERRYEADLAFWRQTLDGAPSRLALSGDGRLTGDASSSDTTRSFTLSAALTQQVRELHRAEGTTLFAVLLAAYQALLAGHTGETDICVGVPVSTRDRDELHDLIGPLLNTVMLRTNLGGDPTWRELIGRVREVAVAAMSHQGVPFEVVSRELGLPPVQAMFTLHPAGRTALQLGDAKIAVARAEGQTSKFDLTLSIDDEVEVIRGQVEGRTDLFGVERLTRVAADFVELLEAAVTQPDLRLSLLSRERSA
ncbi:MAG: amino acid adenylation domain-containing protein [Chloroflexota bacterium]|nr:amino acid adenylation domain-containing protein [Chloroflexota bacterium]